MEQILLKKLDCFRRRIRRMTFYYGFSLILSIFFGSMLLIGLLDWWFRLDSPSGRTALALLEVVLISISVWWLFVRPMRQGSSDLQLAFAIERHHPEFGESLVSTVQFLENRNRHSHDSPELKDRLVLETIRKLEQIELDRMINTKAVRNIVFRAGMAISLILVFAIWNRSEAAIAMKRLFLPYGGYSWPKETQFVLLSTENEPLFQNGETRLRKPQGEVLTILVRNEKGLLPADTQLQIFYPEEDDLIIEENLKRVPMEDDSGSVRYLGLMQIPIRQDKMEFRIRGGDDVTPWYSIDVVPPPKLERLRLEIEPPTYTGKKTVTMKEGVGQLRLVLGTRVRIGARSNKKLKSARLILRNQTPRNLILDPSGKNFSTEFPVREPGLYDWQIVLQDLDGFHNPRNPQFEIRAFEDRPPQIKLLSPLPLRNRDEILATANATVPVRVQASDDFGLKEIALKYKRHHSEETLESLSLYRSGRNDLTEKKKTPTYLWELGNASVLEGMLLGFHIAAVDHYRDPFDRFSKDPHSTDSKTRLLRIVTVAEKTDELLSRRENLIGKLETQKRIQADLVDRTSDLIVQLEQAGSWRTRQDYRHLTALEKNQRAVTTAILDGKDGLTRQATVIKDEAIQNKLRNPTLVNTLTLIERELKSLSTLHLTRIERHLIDVRKSVEDFLTAASPTRRNRFSIPIPEQIEHLKNARYHQIQVIAGLDSLLAEFRRHRNLKDIGEELENILEEEKEISRLTKETKRETFSKSDAELAPQQRADLYRLADKQQRLSPRFGKLVTELEKTLNVLSMSRQPRHFLREISRQISDSRLQSNMQQASRELRTNKLGSAQETISSILDALQTLVRAFAMKDKRDLDFLIAQVKRIERETASCNLQQNIFSDRLKKLSTDDGVELDSLERKERKLLADIEKLSRIIRQWDTKQVADSFHRLESRLQNAIDALQIRNIVRSRRYSQDSLVLFSNVMEDLVRYRQFLEAEQKRELLSLIANSIADMKDRQRDLIRSTKQLHAAFSVSQIWTRPLSRKLYSIRDEEKKLENEAKNLSRTLKNAPVYEMTMRQAAESLGSIVQRLQQRQTDEETVTLQQAVVKMLNDLLESLDVETTDAQPDNTPTEKRSSQSDDEKLISRLAQIKLIESLERDILKKTVEIEKSRQSRGSISSEDGRELTRMAEQQKNLQESMQDIFSNSKSDDAQQKRIEEIVGEMNEVRTKLTARSTGSETQGLQQHIVEELEILIRNLTQRQSPSTPSQTDRKSSSNQNRNTTKSKKTSKLTKSGTSPGDPGGPPKKKKADEKNLQQQYDLRSRFAERKKLINEVWGHLPEVVRLRMLKQTDEKFLLQYREQIKRYFESLATDPKKK